MRREHRRRVCFVTGTRAEFGLMEGVLRAIQAHRKLKLQIIATGMHLDSKRGSSIDLIRNAGWIIDRTVRWREPQRRKKLSAHRTQSGFHAFGTAHATGDLMSGIASAIDELKSDIVLVVGDRVEAFAAAAAAHISGRVVAHVHGGDRALGQIDDSLRHAITKLAHVHFPATSQSATRIRRLGEDAWRIHRAGSPGIDGIHRESSPVRALPDRRFALLVLHPASASESVERRRARLTLRAVSAIPFERIVIIHPNNDPGSEGIAKVWIEQATGKRFVVHKNVSRGQFLSLMRDAAVLVGNSSSGIIEAASFGTPVVDIGPRQLGRQRSGNATSVPYAFDEIHGEIARIWNNGRPRRHAGRNIYAGGARKVIPDVLASLRIDARLLRKLIAY